MVDPGLGVSTAVKTKGMSDPSPGDLWWLRDLDPSRAGYLKTPRSLWWDVVRAGMGWSTGGFTPSCASGLAANTFQQSTPLSRRDVQAGEADSQLPFSPNPPWQPHLCPGAGVCWRRSRRWAGEITEAKAGGEWDRSA